MNVVHWQNIRKAYLKQTMQDANNKYPFTNNKSLNLHHKFALLFFEKIGFSEKFLVC